MTPLHSPLALAVVVLLDVCVVVDDLVGVGVFVGVSGTGASITAKYPVPALAVVSNKYPAADGESANPM